MNTKSSSFFNRNKRLLTFYAIACTLLTLPWIAMQFSQDVHWTVFDFVVMVSLLIAVSTALELLLRWQASRVKKWLCGAALFIAFLLIWAELAVGIFGTPFAGS